MTAPELQAWRRAYAAGDPRADLTGDGRVDALDLAAYVASSRRDGPTKAKDPGGEAVAPPRAPGGEVFLWLAPDTAGGMAGEALSFDVLADFTADPTLGGAFDVTLSGPFEGSFSWSFASSTIGDDPLLRRAPETSNRGLTGIAVGSFDGFTGPGVVGTLTLVPSGGGTGTLALGPSDVSPWVSAVTFDILTPTYGEAALAVMPGETVPLGTVPLILLALLLSSCASLAARRGRGGRPLAG